MFEQEDQENQIVFQEKYDKAKDVLRLRQQAYISTFQENEMTKVVLEDLSKFCRANDSAFHADARLHAVLEGRREVWLRIEKHIKLSFPELWESYSKRINHE